MWSYWAAWTSNEFGSYFQGSTWKPPFSLEHWNQGKPKSETDWEYHMLNHSLFGVKVSLLATMGDADVL